MAHLATHKLISFWDALLSHTESTFKNSLLLLYPFSRCFSKSFCRGQAVFLNTRASSATGSQGPEATGTLSQSIIKAPHSLQRFYCLYQLFPQKGRRAGTAVWMEVGFLCQMASSSVSVGSLFLFLQCCCASCFISHVAHGCGGTRLLSGLLVHCLAGSAVATAAVIWLPSQPCVLIDLSVCTKSPCIQLYKRLNYM